MNERDKKGEREGEYILAEVAEEKEGKKQRKQRRFFFLQNRTKMGCLAKGRRL